MQFANPPSLSLIFPHSSNRRESVSAEAACRFQRTPSEATTNYERDSSCDDRTGAVLRLAGSFGDRQAGDVHQVASQCIPNVLAMEVAESGQTAASQESTRADPRDGP